MKHVTQLSWQVYEVKEGACLSLAADEVAEITRGTVVKQSLSMAVIEIMDKHEVFVLGRDYIDIQDV